MQAAQYPFRRLGVIILDKGNRISYRLFKQLVVKTLKEKATFITKHFWFKNKHIRNSSLDYIHLYIHT